MESENCSLNQNRTSKLVNGNQSEMTEEKVCNGQIQENGLVETNSESALVNKVENGISNHIDQFKNEILKDEQIEGSKDNDCLNEVSNNVHLKEDDAGDIQQKSEVVECQSSLIETEKDRNEVTKVECSPIKNKTKTEITNETVTLEMKPEVLDVVKSLTEKADVDIESEVVDCVKSLTEIADRDVELKSEVINDVKSPADIKDVEIKPKEVDKVKTSPKLDLDSKSEEPVTIEMKSDKESYSNNSENTDDAKSNSKENSKATNKESVKTSSDTDDACSEEVTDLTETSPEKQDLIEIIESPKNDSMNRMALSQLYVAGSSTNGENQGFIAHSSTAIMNAQVKNPAILYGLTNSINAKQPSITPLLSTGQFPRPQSNQVSLLNQAASVPHKPQSSLDQIELIRWEIMNRVNTRPKYFKPNPTAELGSLSQFLFSIGLDLTKEAVYHELVDIQTKKNEENKLSVKEKEDLEKLKEIESELKGTIGHLKFKMRKKCKSCKFSTESSNVLFHHKQFPHEENKVLFCAHCKYMTKQVNLYKYHMTTEHNIQPKVYDRKANFECDLCTYENNNLQKVEIHKVRCIKQFRPLFNLHPSCLSGAEINLCLENIFYKSIVPPKMKQLQEKHAAQQAALAEARRQQLKVQALAAQKNALAVAKRAQELENQRRLQLQRQQTAAAPRVPNRNPTQNLFAPRIQGPRQVRSTPPKPTVANMLKSRQNQLHIRGAGPQVPNGFEICEICGGYVKDRKALRIHFFYAHRIDLPFNLFDRAEAPLYCATCYMRFWTAQGLRKHIEVHKEENQVVSGVSGRCISCGIKSANLIVHIKVVHNKTIDQYLNALMCIFCGKTFSSRTEVEKHIRSMHGNVDFVTGALKGPIMPLPAAAPVKPAKKNSNSNLVKGSVCVLCNLNFGRNVDLTRHCMRMHHTCMKCGMVVIDKPSLLKHTCLISPNGTQDCTMCPETGFHPAYFVKHLRDKHLKKFSIKIARLSKTVIERWTKKPYSLKPPPVVEISDSDDDVVISSSPVKSRPKFRMGPASKMNRMNTPVVRPITATEKSDKSNSEIVETIESDNEAESTAEEMIELNSSGDIADSSEKRKRKLSVEDADEEAPKRKRS